MTDSKTVIPKDLAIGLKRPMYAGACPDYSLFVYGDEKSYIKAGITCCKR